MYVIFIFYLSIILSVSFVFIIHYPYNSVHKYLCISLHIKNIFGTYTHTYSHYHSHHNFFLYGSSCHVSYDVCSSVLSSPSIAMTDRWAPPLNIWSRSSRPETRFHLSLVELELVKHWTRRMNVISCLRFLLIDHFGKNSDLWHHFFRDNHRAGPQTMCKIRTDLWKHTHTHTFWIRCSI